jgi:hypothetical protein
MNWMQIGKTWRSGNYQLLSNIRGWEAWYYSKQKSGCLGREIPTLDKAKAFCDYYAAQQSVRKLTPELTTRESKI